MKRIIQTEERWSGGKKYFVLGNPPEGNCVFVAPSAGLSVYGQTLLYRSVLEAVKNGFDVLHVPGQDYDSIVEDAVYNSMEGRLFLVLPRGIATSSNATLSSALVTGGGILSLEEADTVFSLERLNKAKSFAASISRIMLYADERTKVIPSYIVDGLDEGAELLVLDNALRGKGGRRLLQEGAPSYASFSLGLRNARFFVVPDERGRHCFMGNRFAIMDANGKL